MWNIYSSGKIKYFSFGNYDTITFFYIVIQDYCPQIRVILTYIFIPCPQFVSVLQLLWSISLIWIQILITVFQPSLMNPVFCDNSWSLSQPQWLIAHCVFLRHSIFKHLPSSCSARSSAVTAAAMFPVLTLVCKSFFSCCWTGHSLTLF